MDPISHGLIGAGVAALSGQPFAWDNPIYLGSILGAMAPDLDIVMQARGHVAYLKHHRGISHSIPGLLGFSALVSLGLLAIFPTTPFWNLFFWTFMGTLSHGVFDLLNSYGAKLLWPFVKKRITVNFVMVTDPLILSAFMIAFLFRQQQYVEFAAFFISAIYLCWRWSAKQKVAKLLKQDLGKDAEQILVLPAMYKPFSWDFVIETKDRFVTGTAPFGKNTLVVREILTKEVHPCIDVAEESALGDVFREFTPCYHVTRTWQENQQVIEFADLRYYVKDSFMHTGTAVVDQEGELLEAIFQPYSKKKVIKIA
jgi:inner membrane protein